MNIFNKIFSKKTYIVLNVIAIIVIIIVFFISHYKYNVPLLLNIINSILSIIALTGLFLCYKDFIKTGIILQSINILGFIIKGYIFKENIFTSFYFIAFLILLIWYIYDAVKKK